MLYSTLVLTNTFATDSFEVNSKNLNRKMKRVGYAYLPRLNIDGETYFVQGPFAPNTNVEMKLNAKTFNLKTGIETVYHYDDLLKEFIAKPLGGIKGAFLHFSESPLQLAALNMLLVPDTLLPLPTEAPMKYKEETAKALMIKEEEYFYQSRTASVQDGFVRFFIENKNDTNYIKSMWIINRSNFQACDYIQSVSRGNTQVYRRAIQEPFDVYLFYNKNRMAILKNIKQENQNEFYINAQLVKTVPFDKEKIEEPLKIYAELNAVPLLPFYDAPYISKDKIKRVAQARNNLYMHGMITDENQMPLDGALVYVELNGVFKYGAVNNSNGLFEFLDVLPATYQLKIYHPDYSITHYESMLFEAKTEYVINTSLKEKCIFHPLFEVVQSDFRMMAFIQNNQENKLKVSIHDKESRSVLNDVQLKLIFLNETIKTFTLNQTTTEIPFYLSKTLKIFSIELSKPGYTTIRLNGIEFVKNYTYVLEAFLGLEKKEILKQKEYNINMLGQLPEYEKPLNIDNSGSDKSYSVEESGPSNTPPPFPNLRRGSGSADVKKSPSVSTSNFATVQSGAYQGKSGDASINAGGDRLSSTTYMIDGMTMTGSTTANYTLPATSNFEVLSNGISASYGYFNIANSSKTNYADASMIDQVISNENTSTIRKTFSDVGYWQPNLITNKMGIAAFTVKLPDNITSWKSYIVGVGRRWLHGTDEAETKVYKPLQTISMVPMYLYAKDKVEALVQDVMTDTSKPIQSTLVINDTLKIKTFPYQLNIAHSTYSIKHIGADVFVNTSEEYFVENPSIHDSVFAVRTSFKQNNIDVTALKSGIACQYNITIQAYKTGEHVMVEIPLPAGLKVKQKNKNFGKGDYVEYYKHKVVYYFEKLPMGMKSLTIDVMPVFKGEFIVPATKSSLMYYPFVYGNSLNATISIQ